MVDEGGLLDAFPASPIPTETLRDLENHESIRRAVPMMARFHGDEEVTDRAIIQTETTAVVVSHTRSGWVVEHRVTGTDRDPDEVFEEAMLQAQAEQEELVAEMEEMAESHMEVEGDSEATEEG